MFDSLFSRLHDEFRRLWLYRWFMVMVTAISFVVIAGVAISLPKRYDAWSEIYVDKLSMLSAATDKVSLSATPAAVVNPRILLNDDRLSATLLKVHPEMANLSPKQMSQAVNRFRNSIQVLKVDDDGFLQFHVKDVDPVRAARVAQELTDQFISMSLGRNQDDLGETTKFLDGQIATYKGLVDQSQQQMANFRQAHPGLILPGGFGSDNSDGSSVVTVAAPVSAGVSTAAPAAPAAPVQRTFPEDQKIAQLEAQLANLLTQYTDQHPDVVNTRAQLAALLRSRAAAAAAAPPVTAPVAAPTAAAPAPRMMQQVVRSRTRAPVPADVASEWASLLANDQMVRGDYQQLVSRQQAAKMSEAILGSSKRFEIIRPVRVPEVSVTPGRSILVILSAFVAGIIGLGATFLRAAVSGVLVSPRELEEEFDLPVAATVSWEPAWQTGHVAKVDPRFIPPFLRPRRVAYASSQRQLGREGRS